MKQSKRHRVKRADRARGQRRGAMLVLLLLFIVLASSLAVLIMASAAQLARTNRHEQESILVRQIAASGLAWSRLRTGLRPDAQTTLGADDVLPEGISGEVTIGRSGTPGGVIVVIVHVRFPDHPITRTFRFLESL